METPDYRDKCYKTKNDKLHATIFYRGDLASETPDEREQRLKTIHENRGTWIWDEKKRELVRKEEYVEEKQEVDAPKVSGWNSEWTVVATGKRMSKGELKRYCKERGKTWQN